MISNFSKSLVLSATLSLPACSNKTVEPKMYSGFLHDYSLLSERQSPSGQTVLGWVSPALARGRYTQAYLAPSQFYPSVAPTERIPLSTLSGVTEYYDAALRQELGKVMRLVSTPSSCDRRLPGSRPAPRVCAFMNGCRSRWSQQA
jgi:hypothetical protein